MLVYVGHYFGAVLLMPKSYRIARSIARDMRRNGAPNDVDGGAMISEDDLPGLLTRHALAAFKRDAEIIARVDDWTFRHVCGYCDD